MNNVELKPEEQLSQLFGSYKAEWLREQIYELFKEPSYMPELKTSRPCMLIGGRGTGKTTVLRCLSYEGLFALDGSRTEKIDSWSYYGMYYRVNTNRVTAFKGDELDLPTWTRLFAHYFNILLCDLMIRFLEWYHRHCPNEPQLDESACAKVAKSLNLPSSIKTTRDLANEVDNLKIEFEAHINNIASKSPLLSVQGAPIDILSDAIVKLPQFSNKNFFFLLDEYENFEDYQQQVVNTLIKHSGQNYTFKIGVRELGLRRRTTLNENEQLIHPADYVRINISEKLTDERFNKFALAVCNARLLRVQLHGQPAIQDISKILPGLTEDDEAAELGIEELIKPIKETLYALSSKDQKKRIDQCAPLEIYFISFWAESKKELIENIYKDFLKNPEDWKIRYENYKHALLYTIRRHKRGIQKYYAGWEVFVSLSANNIRYLLELVDQSLISHLNSGRQLSEPVTPKVQTIAAQNTGKKNLSELEGLSVHGAKLTKLLLSLGRVFQVMAADIVGHTPELNQFHLAEDPELSATPGDEVKQLLTSAVMHLALIRYPGNKLLDEADIRDYDYMIHPIFSPFFIFSYRKKRKMKLTSEQLLGLVYRPKETIREILLQHNRSSEEMLPDQLLLFEGYYFDR